MDVSLGSAGIIPGVVEAQRYRLAILVSHPIQYFVPLFKHLARQPEIDLTVVYCSLHGAEAGRDPGFRRSFAWDVPLLDGYRYKLLRNYWPGQLGEGFFTRLNPGVVREFQRGGYDAVIIFGWRDFTYCLGLVAAYLSRLPWIMGGAGISLFEDDARGLKKLLKKLILGTIFRRTGAFLVRGRSHELSYERYGVTPGRFFFMPMAVDNEFFSIHSDRAKPHRATIRARYQIPSDAVLLLFAGKLLPGKRPQDILAVLARLQAVVPQLCAAFVGEGELRPFLEAEMRRLGLNNAFLLGFKNLSEMPEMYAMSDVLVMPSNHEAWGLVTNEAMATGLPVVVSNRVGASMEIIRDGDNGFVYPVGDIDSLARIVRRVAEDPSLRERMGRRSREIIQGISYDQCVTGILAAVQSLCMQSTGISPRKR
jgi:glycosyltransferase involved in cell wall biosynthesis